MTATIVDIGTLISKSPDVYHGRAVIAGTRVPVMIIAHLHDQGMTAEEIAREKYLTPLQAYAAVTYYLANHEEIENDIAEEAADYDSGYEEWQQLRAEGRA